MPTSVKSRFNIHPLAASMRPTHRYDFYVTGRGAFPFDMLRYDDCWPASTEDAAMINQDYTSDKNRSIKLHSYHAPTVERWSSFLWAVGSEKL